MIFASLERYRDHGLLFLRAGIGLMYMGHGAPKLFGGPEVWAKIGSAMGTLGIHFVPAFWGFMAGCTEFFGGLLLALGLFFRPALVLLSFTMFVATATVFSSGRGFTAYSRPFEMLILLVSLIFIGPGIYSLDRKWRQRRKPKDIPRREGVLPS